MSNEGTFADQARNGNLDTETCATILTDRKTLRLSDDNYVFDIRKHRDGDLEIRMSNTSGGYCGTFREQWSMHAISGYLDRTTDQRILQYWPGDRR